MRSTLSRRLGAAIFAAILVVAGLMAAPGAAVASPHHQPARHHGHGHGHHGHGHHGHGHHPYQAPVQSNPHLSAHRAHRGAVAGISVSHHLSGRAWVSVRPGRTYSVRVSNGHGAVYFPTQSGRTYRITVVFVPSGHRWAVGGSDTIVYRAGSAHAYGSNPTISLTSSTTQTAAASVANGPDGTAAAMGLLGVGLVGAGTLSIAVNRRRNRAGS